MSADDRHGDGVEIFAVDEKQVPKESLRHEANLLVERDCACVVGARIEFVSANPCRKAASSATSSNRKPIPRPRHSATTPIPMGEGGKGMPPDVAPADDFVRPVGDERRTTRPVLMQDEVAHRLHRKASKTDRYLRSRATLSSAR
jgi:hypothetical protein